MIRKIFINKLQRRILKTILKDGKIHSRPWDSTKV